MMPIRPSHIQKAWQSGPGEPQCEYRKPLLTFLQGVPQIHNWVPGASENRWYPQLPIGEQCFCCLLEELNWVPYEGTESVRKALDVFDHKGHLIVVQGHNNRYALVKGIDGDDALGYSLYQKFGSKNILAESGIKRFALIPKQSS